MARLHNSRRPLVVSFRRKKPQIPRRTKQVFFDIDLQEALDNLKRQPNQRRNNYSRNSPRNRSRSSLSYNDSKITDYSFVTLNNLEPKHICPLSNETTAYVIKDPISRIEDIEIFQEQRLKIHKATRQQKKRNEDIYDRSPMTKSCTMPQMLFNQRNGSDNGSYANISGVVASWNGPSVWSCDDVSERSSSCSRLELIMENGDKNLTCRHSDGIIIQVP